MAWTRMGDNVVTHPLMSRLLTACDFDHALKNEAWGALSQLTSTSAAHLTDYYVEYGLMAQVAPGRERILIDVLVKAGMLEEVKIEGRAALKVVEDEELLHNRLKEEVMIDRNRASDKRKPELIIPVRLRDGDQCRWCCKTVSWVDRKSARAGTIDSLNSHKNSTPETLVVACKACNSKRKDGVELELQPEPNRKDVYYTEHTARIINESDWARDRGIEVSPRKRAITIEVEGQQQMIAATSDVTTACDHQVAGTDTFEDPFEDAPDWVKEGLLQTDPMAAPGRQQQVDMAAAPDGVAAPPVHRAAPGTVDAPGTVEVAAPGRQQQVDMAAAPDGVAAPPVHRAAPGTVDAPKNNPTKIKHKSNTNQTQDLVINLDHQGDVSRSVGSGRDGTGLDGNSRRRRRGRRGGKKLG